MSDGDLRVAHGLLLPGKVIGDGRYRLLERTGTDERHKAHLWLARDGQSRQDVALTILTGDPENAGAMRRARKTLGRAAHPVSLAHPGIARVVNVVSVGDGVPRDEGVLGMVVAEWTPGTALSELVARGPVPPAEACRLLEPLAAAVGQAHHNGLVLGVGHPQRIRVTDGGLRLAFPGPPDRRLRDDVRGLGALLYLLLTGRWPGFRRPRAIVAPKEVRPEVPAELSEIAVRSLDESSIRTSDTILQALRRGTTDDERTERIRPISDGTAIWTTKPPVADPVRSKRLKIGVAVLLVLSMAALAWIGAMFAGLFAADSGVSEGPSATMSPPGPPNGTQVRAGRITPAGVEVFNAANGAGAARAVDGDPATAWQTTKPGIGLTVSFPRPMRPAHVVIDSPSAGTVVEIRAADSARPKLADTRLLGSAALTAGSTAIELRSTVPVQYVIVWITQLSGSESAIGEVSVAE